MKHHCDTWVLGLKDGPPPAPRRTKLLLMVFPSTVIPSTWYCFHKTRLKSHIAKDSLVRHFCINYYLIICHFLLVKNTENVSVYRDVYQTSEVIWKYYFKSFLKIWNLFKIELSVYHILYCSDFLGRKQWTHEFLFIKISLNWWVHVTNIYCPHKYSEM